MVVRRPPPGPGVPMIATAPAGWIRRAEPAAPAANGSRSAPLHRYGHYDTYLWVKTTVEISDPLLDTAKAVAVREGTTVRALIEEALRRLLDERRSRKQFRLRKASFKGHGLQPGMREGDWEQIAGMIYEGRG